MFIDLRDCVYDEDEEGEEPQAGATHPDFDVEALERAAEARVAESAAARARPAMPRRGAGQYQQTAPAQSTARVLDTAMPRPEASIFGGQVLRGKSLDEVILSYLSDDLGEEK
jgi:hypothetical protein